MIEHTYCAWCGCEIAAGETACPECEHEILLFTLPDSRKSSLLSMRNELADNAKKIKNKTMSRFSEAEMLFASGTELTTPALHELPDKFPKPWVFAIIFLLFLEGIMLSYNGSQESLPSVIMLGSCLVPFTLLTLIYEYNVFRNISFLFMMAILLIGGGISLFIAGHVNKCFVDFSDGISVTEAWSIGITEEIAKLIPLAFILLPAKRKKYRTILAAMLIGACVGAGFAVFESADYAMKPVVESLQKSVAEFKESVTPALQAAEQSLNAPADKADKESLTKRLSEVTSRVKKLELHWGDDKMWGIIILRGVLSPGGHILWAAMTAVMLVLAGKIKLSRLSGYAPRTGAVLKWICRAAAFIIMFAVPVVLHSVWDMPYSGWRCYLLSAIAVVVAALFLWLGWREAKAMRSNSRH